MTNKIKEIKYQEMKGYSFVFLIPEQNTGAPKDFSSKSKHKHPLPLSLLSHILLSNLFVSVCLTHKNTANIKEQQKRLMAAFLSNPSLFGLGSSSSSFSSNPLQTLQPNFLPFPSLSPRLNLTTTIFSGFPISTNVSSNRRTFFNPYLASHSHDSIPTVSYLFLTQFHP